MTKKILITCLFLCINLGFSQQKPVSNLMALPNPFAESTIISFDSTKEQGVILTFKNVLGKTVYQKAHYAKKGKAKIVFHRKALKNGIYIYTIQSESNTVSKRVIIK